MTAWGVFCVLLALWAGPAVGVVVFVVGVGLWVVGEALDL